jgi:hypothetical protein
VLAAQGGVVEAEVRTKEQVFQEPPTLEEVEGLLVIPMLEIQTIHLAMAVAVLSSSRFPTPMPQPSLVVLHLV